MTSIRSSGKQAGIQPGAELTLEYRDGKIEIEPVRRPVRIARRGSRLVLAAPPGPPALSHEQVNRILEEVREERIRRDAPRRR